ncbi:MAG: Ig-like domain-containing protein [Saprospiraceae bacterium]|nr:Ig-like domain-containing protein [Saprospiraceae bacterium]
MNIKNSVFFLVSIALLQSCANIVAPTGGNKDTTPPKIVESKSTPNFQTNFKKQRIELTFDEWVKLEDAFNQVVVSPPLNEQPKVEQVNKKIVFEFGKNEVLRENATYTINFGNAVKDLSEGNPAKDLRFVFSTGAIIDSLTVRGRVIDAVTGVPTEGAVLMLYDNLADSVVRKIKPFYFGKTDKNGEAIIENVREGKFKVFALLDKDLNYLFNQDVEKIGFPDDFFNVTAEFTASKLRSDTAKITKRDSLSKADSLKRVAQANSGLINIRLFDPPKKWQLLTKETDKYGVIKLIANQDPTGSKVTFDNVNQKIATEISKDTILLYYDLPSGDAAWNVYVKNDTSQTDTIRIRPRGRVDFFKKNKTLVPLNMQSSFAKNPAKAFSLTFANPIENIDNQKIILLDSAKKSTPLSIRRDSSSQRRLIFEANWVEGVPYNLTVQPDALTDIFGLKNDTVTTKIQVQKKAELGTIIIKVKGLDSLKHYVVQVLSGSGLVEAEFFVDNKTALEKRIEMMQPDEYKLKVVEDTNRNRRWDTGNYDKKTQPERIFWKTIEGLRADWEVETEFDINQ